MTSWADSSLHDLPAEDQRALAQRIAEIVGPYGSIAPSVLDGEGFQDLLDRLIAASAGGDEQAMRLVRGDAESIIARFDEELDGPGFYALAAVIEIFYATEAALIDADIGLSWAVARLRDIADFAEDEGCEGLFCQAEEWLQEPTPGRADGLAERVAGDAARRHDQAP